MINGSPDKLLVYGMTTTCLKHQRGRCVANSLVDLFIKQEKPLDGLLFAERAKGRVLLDVPSGSKADLAKVLTPSEKKDGQRLNRNISAINDRIKAQQSADSSTLNSLYAQLDAARLEYRFFQDALYVAHPDLRVRTGRTAALTSADIKHLTLNKDCAYLEYVVSNEQIYVFVLTTKSATASPELKAYRLPIKPEDLATTLTSFIRGWLTGIQTLQVSHVNSTQRWRTRNSRLSVTSSGYCTFIALSSYGPNLSRYSTEFMKPLTIVRESDGFALR